MKRFKDLRIRIMKWGMKFKEYWIYGEGHGKFVRCPHCNKPIRIGVTKTVKIEINKCKY